jgi:cytoskeletal protein CcmA (bactofilin family)
MAKPSQDPSMAPTATTPPVGRPDNLERRSTAWISKAVTITGDVTSGEDLMLDGHVDGNVTLEAHSVTIGAGGAVHGNLRARRVTVGGAVTGGVLASERVEIHETGSVDGDIQTPRLAIREGAVVRGRVDTDSARTHQATPFAKAV